MDETIKVTGLSKSYAGNKVISNIEIIIPSLIQGMGKIKKCALAV